MLKSIFLFPLLQVKFYPLAIILSLACSLNAISIVNYELVEGSFSWEDAKLDAESRGGTLAILDTDEKMTQAYNYLMTELDFWSQNDLWFGLTDEVTEGQWKWIDGTDLIYSNWYGTGFGAEPNNNGRQLGSDPLAENYASIFRNDYNHHPNGEWNDRVGSTQLSYLLQTVPEPSTYALILGAIALGFAFRRGK